MLKLHSFLNVKKASQRQIRKEKEKEKEKENWFFIKTKTLK